MSEWRRRWEFTCTWDSAAHSPIQAKTYNTQVDTPAELRHLVERARSDVNVVSYRYKPVQRLVGERPIFCGRGHPYDGGTATRVELGWARCDCGGHVLYRCQSCDDVQIDPVISVDCVYRGTVR